MPPNMGGFEYGHDTATDHSASALVSCKQSLSALRLSPAANDRSECPFTPIFDACWIKHILLDEFLFHAGEVLVLSRLVVAV